MLKPHGREDLEVVVESPVGGLNEAASINTMADNQATEALNVSFAEGTLAKRYGYVRIGDQVNPAAWAAERICFWATQYVKRDGTSQLLAVFGTHLYKLSGATWVGAISGTNPAGATDVFGGGKNLGTHVQFNDVIYYADGDVTKRYTGTAIEDWSFAGGTLAAAVLALNGAGSLSDGVYTMVYTLYNSTLGEETNPSTVSAGVDTAAINKAIDYTIARPAGYTSNFNKLRIYRTVADGAGAWFFEEEVAVHASWAGAGPYTDVTGSLNIADAALGAEVAYDNDPTPKWRFVRLHDERVVGGNIQPSNPSQVQWSKAGAPFSVPAVNAQFLKRDDGHPIRGIFEAMFGNLYVGKRGGPIFQLNPHPTLGYAPLQLPALHGLESHHSAISVGNETAFVDRLGIVRFNGQQTEVMSAPVSDTFRTLAAQADTNATGEVSLLERCFGIYDQQSDQEQARWTFALATTASVSDDQLVADIKNEAGGGGAWHREQYRARGFRVFFSVQDQLATGNKTPAIYAADGDGQVWRLRTSTAGVNLFDDNGAVYTMRWYSKWFGDGRNDILPRYLDVEFERSADLKKSGCLKVLIWKDGEVTPVVTKEIQLFDSFDSPALRKTVRVDIPVPRSGQYWQRLRVGFEHTEKDGDLSILSFAILGKQIGRRLLGVA